TTVTLANVAAPSITNVSVTDPTCGTVNGDITITASGGTGALQYSIDNGVTFQAGNNFTGLGPATYDIVVEDAAGCQGTTTVTLTDPGAPSITSVTANDPTCGLNNGDITIAATGGTPALVYSIDNGVTFQAGNNFAGLAGASYNIVVEDALGCQATTILVLMNAGAPSITVVTPTDPTCGNSDGQINITATGGTPVLVYSNDNGVTFQASNVFIGLTAATYDIVVEDAAGCQVSATVTLTNTVAPSITNVSVTDPACGAGDGIITITASGGSGALSYSIDNGVTFQAGNNFTGLGPATYDIVVEDALGCQSTTTVMLTDLGAPSITSVGINDPTCGLNNGDLTINATGGTGALQYSIDNGVTFQASNNFTALAGVTYNIVVEDALGCSVSTTATLTNAGAPTISNVVTTDPTCGLINGDITITASGGTGALQYSIDNGVTFQASNVFGGLGVASYDIVVEDILGCQVSTMVSLTSLGSPVISSVTFTDPTCGLANGDITITASGGTGAMTYSINNGSTFQGSNLFNGLLAGPYDIVVEDAIGCQVTSTVTLTDPGAPLISSTNSTDPTCGLTNGDITITASGGIGVITYSIDNGVTFQAGNNFTGLGATTYNIVIEDAIGCQTTLPVILVDQAGPVISDVNTTDATCGLNNGALAIIASGGSGTLQYSIDNGVTFFFNNNYTVLAGNTYDIVVEDTNGCQTSTTAVVNATPAVSFVIDLIGHVLCQGDATGSVDITVVGGILPYQFDWSDDGIGDLDDAENLINVPVGTYSLTVYDSVGCTAFTSVTITEPTSMISLSAIATDETFGNDGTIDLTVTGGTGPYLFDWDNDGTGDNDDTEDLNSLVGNQNYTVIVTDQNGCTETLVVYVTSVVGLSHLTDDMGVSIFPNPNSGEFDIIFENYSGQATMEVVDMAGRLVYKDVKSVVVGESYHVTLLSASNGVYFLNIMSETGIHSVRIIKR
ncbi:MAG: T9SS type A sorting domain-containing protein, partial [Crocinitomicaceae bacterium]|nr:T9SS type A sorting domain-containing protein [Crocinitomicaceae bacterium]